MVVARYGEIGGGERGAGMFFKQEDREEREGGGTRCPDWACCCLSVNPLDETSPIGITA